MLTRPFAPDKKRQRSGTFKRVMAVQRGDWTTVLLKLADGRISTVTCTGKDETPSCSHILTDDGYAEVRVESNYFESFIANMVRFFRTGALPVKREDTIAIIAIRKAILKAARQPGMRMASRSMLFRRKCSWQQRTNLRRKNALSGIVTCV